MLRREAETTQRNVCRPGPRDACRARGSRSPPADATDDRLGRRGDRGAGRGLRRGGWAAELASGGAAADARGGTVRRPVRSRQAHEQVGYNLLYRAFVGLGVDEAVPDDTTLVRFRARVGEAGIREVFDALNQQWAAAGLLGTERRVLGRGASVGEGGAAVVGGAPA